MDTEKDQDVLTVSDCMGTLVSWAPSGHRNGNYRDGRQTKEAIAERQFMRALIKQSRELVKRAGAALTASF